METTDDEKERLRLNNDSETPAAMMTGEIAQASVVRHQEQGAFGDAPRVWPKEDLDCESRSERSADVSQVFNRHTASASMDGSVAETSASAITRRRPKMTTMAGGAGVASDDDEGHFDGDGECRSSGSGSIRGDGHVRVFSDPGTSWSIDSETGVLTAGAGDSAARENDDNGSEEKRDHIRPSFNVRGTNGLGGVHSRHLSGDCDGDRAEATEGRSRATSTTSGWRPTSATPGYSASVAIGPSSSSSSSLSSSSSSKKGRGATGRESSRKSYRRHQIRARNDWWRMYFDLPETETLRFDEASTACHVCAVPPLPLVENIGPFV